VTPRTEDARSAEPNSVPPETGEAEESRLVRERREKIRRLVAEGIDPYPHTFVDRTPAAQVVRVAVGLEPGASAANAERRVAGRIRTIRQHGRTSFLDIEDESSPLQILVRVDELGEAAYRRWLSVLDPGDVVGAVGPPARSRRGEPSLLARELVLLAKALRPPPEKYHGLKDVETRLRRRYVDLLASSETRRRFAVRARLTDEVRQFLREREFLEMETPILLPVASGAAAEPFVTHSRYLDADLQLRIAIELNLKRLVVGGFEKVFEVGRIFRNEDLDATHAPEFTMLELYWAYADYRDMRELLESMLERLAAVVAESWPDSRVARSAPERFRRPLAQVDFLEELERRSGLTGLLDRSREELRSLGREAGATVPDDSPAGVFLDKLFDRYVAPHLERPTFVLDHPAITTPLAKRHRTRPGRVERFELFANTYELANAYTELNDPEEQDRRFREQASARGDERYAYDADFVEALRYGMPPTAGIGVGLDRVAMAMLGIPSIKDVILFPPTRARD
jgi:lysyl-tRNA synthetase class 2